LLLRLAKIRHLPSCRVYRRGQRVKSGLAQPSQKPAFAQTVTLRRPAAAL